MKIATVESPPADFDYAMSVASGWFEEDMADPAAGRARQRVWQTVHSVVYDMASLKGYWRSQEKGEYRLIPLETV